MDYRIISADSHLEISMERWVDRVPAQYRDRAPRRVTLANGGDAWQVENRPLLINGLNLCAGRPYSDFNPIGLKYEDSPGTGGPEQRLHEQDVDGVDAEILFPGVGGPNFWRGIRDNNAYRAVIHAYNEFLVEEYCAVAPDRLLAMGLIPEVGVDGAIAEMTYCAGAGLRGVMLNSLPSGKSFPTPEDDRFWAAARDLDMPLTAHVRFGFPGDQQGPRFTYKHIPEDIGTAGANLVERLGKYGAGGAMNAIQLVIAQVFERFPELRILWAENQIGWIPNFLEQIDDIYERNHYWAARLLDLPPLPKPPSEYLRQNCWWSFMRNPYGVRQRHEIGVQHVMWANDFPHLDGNWPHSARIIEENFAGVPQDEQRLMVAGNAIAFFGLDREAPNASRQPAGAAAGR